MWLLLFAAMTLTCAHTDFSRGELLNLPAAASPTGYSRGESNWLRKRRLGGPNNNVMPNGRLRIPTPTRDCLVSWNDFLTHVVGRTYITIYGIKNHEEIFDPKSFKAKLRWTLNGTFVNRAGSLWDVLKKPAPACEIFRGNFQRLDSTTASWRAVGAGLI